MTPISNIDDFLGLDTDGYQIDLQDCDEIGSISQDTCQYDNYSITLYSTEDGIILHEDQSNASEYYLLTESEAKNAQEDPDGFLKSHAELWAENAEGSDQMRLEMIAWGLREPSDYDVEDDYEGECKIIVQKYYYGPYSPLSYFSDDMSGEPVIFDNKEAAQQRIDDLDDETYCLSHNEASRPSYTIVKS